MRAPGFISLEHGQASAMHQIMHKHTDENRLACARKAGNAQSKRWGKKACRPVCQRIQRDPCFIAETGQFCQYALAEIAAVSRNR